MPTNIPQSLNSIYLLGSVISMPWTRHDRKRLSLCVFKLRFVQRGIRNKVPLPGDLGVVTCHYEGADAENMSKYLHPLDRVMIDGWLRTPTITTGPQAGHTWMELVVDSLVIIGQAKHSTLSIEQLAWPIGTTKEGELRSALPPEFYASSDKD